MKYATLEITFPTFPSSKHLQAIDSSIVTITNSLSNKIGETFCEGLKLNMQTFQEKWTKIYAKALQIFICKS